MNFDPSKLFGADSEDEKKEAFEESTLALVLTQLGWPSADIKAKRAELGPAFGWSWFNNEQLVLPTVGSTRCFRFNFFDLFTKPAKHELTKEWLNFAGSFSSEGGILIFKVFEHGRWIITDQPCSQTHTRIVIPNATFNLVPFTNFFSGPT